MWSISLLIFFFALLGAVAAAPAPIVNLRTAGAPVYIETGITDLDVAQEHLASSLTGGLYIQQKDKPQRLSVDEAGLVKAEGGSGWVRISRRRHLDY